MALRERSRRGGGHLAANLEVRFDSVERARRTNDFTERLLDGNLCELSAALRLAVVDPESVQSKQIPNLLGTPPRQSDTGTPVTVVVHN